MPTARAGKQGGARLQRACVAHCAQAQQPHTPAAAGPFCHRALLTLEEKQVPYTKTLVDFGAKPEWLFEVRRRCFRSPQFITLAGGVCKAPAAC